MRFFNLKPEGGIVSINRQLLSFLRTLPEFDGYETQPMMIFLYDEINLHGAEYGTGKRL